MLEYASTGDKSQVTGNRWQVAGDKYQQSAHLEKGAGGRRPKALKSGHRARRAQGMAVAKRYVSGEPPLF